MDHDQPDSDLAPSKSQRKRDAKALQDLGARLIALSDDQLQRLQLPADLYEAVRLAQRIRERGGRKRQLLYVGKLLRDTDAEPIQDRVDALQLQHREAAAQFHRLERWRERLIEEGDGALEDFLREHPDADRQRLRQLIRNAQQERTKGATPKAARALFRYLREVASGEVLVARK